MLKNGVKTIKKINDVHVGTFKNLSRNFRKIDAIARGIFRKPLIFDIKLADIKISIDTIKKTQEYIVSDGHDIIIKIDLVKYLGKILHRRINNVVY